MILLELFTGTHNVRDLDPDEVEELLINPGMGEQGDVARAYVFEHSGRRIIIWFNDLSKGRYECSFGLRSDSPYDYPYDFNPTGTGNEFKVYSAVAQCIREFISEFAPNAITMVGYDDRQSALYKKAARRVMLPAGYEFDNSRPNGVNIVKVDQQ